MARKKYWSEDFELTSKIPIDITIPKVYVLANTPFNENHWTRTFRTLSANIVLAKATQKFPLSKNIELTIEASSSLDTTEIEDIIDKMSYELGLNEEMKVLRKLKDEDTIIDIASHSNPGFRLFANSDGIEAAVLTIISQNTSLFIYLEIVENFLYKFGMEVPWNKSFRLFPTKTEIASMTEKDWLGLKLGYKARFLGNLNEDVLNDIETYAFYPILERGIDGLRNISGIGSYTARILAIYHSRRYDYPFYDSYVLEVLNHKYDIGIINNIRQFDRWIKGKWPQDPAIVLHALLLEYLPEYLRSHKTFYAKLSEKPVSFGGSKAIKKTIKKNSKKKTKKTTPKKRKSTKKVAKRKSDSSKTKMKSQED